jgi:hypothetical protein
VDVDVEVVMDDRRDSHSLAQTTIDPDPSELCPNCGQRGTPQKCKLICTNPRCGTHVIMACVD